MSTVVQFAATGEGSTDPILLSRAWHSCPESMAIIEQGYVLCANRAFVRIFGYQETSEIQGRALADFVPAGRACTRLSAEVETATECGYPSCEFNSTRRDGTRIRVQASCAGFRVRERNLLVVSMRDISQGERRRLVRDSDKRFRAIFDGAAIGIVQCAMDGRVVESNPAAERMLGYSRAELRGMHFRDFTHPEDVDSDLKLFQELVEGERDGYEIELRYLRKDGGIGWVRLTVSLVRGPDGSPEFAIGMVEDITARKRTEQQLREAQKMEAIGRLVSGVAHDFNNLLTGIMLYCDLLISGLDGRDHLRHHAEEIRLAGEQGGALIQQLLAVARQQVVAPQVLAINDVIAGMRNLVSRLIGEDIELVADLADGLWRVKMDPAQLQQIILNLLLNARDAMPDGGRVELRTRNCAACKNCGECIELTVTDTGCGMDRETRAHLFEPFFTTKRPGRGNGLGLATVHGIVKQEGGTIEVESEVGQGTRVVVRLPRFQEEPESLHPRRRTVKQGGHETILLVEDNAAVRESARRVLEECGYAVLEAANGGEALNLSRQHTGEIDVLVADLVMPGMNGREVARRLRQARPDLRILYMSGYDATPDAVSGPETILLFRKPFTGSALAEKLREILDEPQPGTQVSHEGRS